MCDIDKLIKEKCLKGLVVIQVVSWGKREPKNVGSLLLGIKLDIDGVNSALLLVTSLLDLLSKLHLEGFKHGSDCVH